MVRMIKKRIIPIFLILVLPILYSIMFIVAEAKIQTPFTPDDTSPRIMRHYTPTNCLTFDWTEDDIGEVWDGVIWDSLIEITNNCPGGEVHLEASFWNPDGTIPDGVDLVFYVNGDRTRGKLCNAPCPLTIRYEKTLRLFETATFRDVNPNDIHNWWHVVFTKTGAN